MKVTYEQRKQKKCNNYLTNIDDVEDDKLFETATIQWLSERGQSSHTNISMCFPYITHIFLFD